MDVSVIIPAYNAEETITDTLESLLAQTYANWEAIVVDDGSRDKTADIAREFTERDNRIRLIQQQNGGESAARNTGVNEARNDWLLFLDADDWISPLHLERLTNELSGDLGLDAVHCLSARVACDGTLVTEEYLPPSGDMFSTLARRAAFPVHACIVRRSLVKAVGKFDTTFKRCADWDLWQRIARTGARFGAVREVLSFYRMRPNSASLDAHLMLNDILRVLRQGHSPDPRVQNPHPDHAHGLLQEKIQSQEFYLLSWCAGILLGRGEDARSLLDSVKEDNYPDLYPEAVAECIFEALFLSICQPPHALEKLFPGIQQKIDDFLLALEKHSMSPDLACRAIIKLKKLILKHSSIWQSIIEEYEQSIEKQRIHTEELKHIKALLEDQRNNWQRLAEERQLTIEKQKVLIEEGGLSKRLLEKEHKQAVVKHETLINTLEQYKLLFFQQRNNWQRLAEERHHIMEKQKICIAELEHDKALTEKERDDLQRLEKEYEQTVARLKAQSEELERSRAFSEEQRKNWQRLAEERESEIAELQQRYWIRLGLGLGVLKQFNSIRLEKNRERNC